MMKISKEEKALIRAYVKYQNTVVEIDLDDVRWIEKEVTNIINNKNMEYRNLVEEYIIKLINKMNN